MYFRFFLRMDMCPLKFVIRATIRRAAMTHICLPAIKKLIWLTVTLKDDTGQS